MAHNYLGVDQNKNLELIGERYFESLATRSFFLSGFWKIKKW